MPSRPRPAAGGRSCGGGPSPVGTSRHRSTGAAPVGEMSTRDRFRGWRWGTRRLESYLK